MRKIREVLRLNSIPDTSERTIAISCNIARSSVSEYLRRAEDAGFFWPLPDDLGDDHLETLLFPPQSTQKANEIPLPDWSYMDY